MEILDEEGKPIEGVYRIDANRSVTRILSHEIHRPNGIAISVDERFLFVADNASGQPDGNRKLWRFDLDDDGNANPDSRLELFDWRSRLGIDRGPDGMALGKDGNLYVTAGWNFNDAPTSEPRIYKAGVYVIDPSGQGLQRFIPIPQDDITNCAFGGEDGNTLFITAGQRLFSVEIEVKKLFERINQKIRCASKALSNYCLSHDLVRVGLTVPSQPDSLNSHHLAD